MDGKEFLLQKPPKDIEEKVEQIKQKLAFTFDQKLSLFKENKASASLFFGEKT